MSLESLADNRYLLAVFTAIVGFGFAVLLERLKNKKVLRKRISWDTAIIKSPQFEDDGNQDISVHYKGIRVEDLIQVQIRVSNTGNTVVKNEYIRFKFPAKAKILDVQFDPLPERELDVEEVADQNLSDQERRYRIGHLEAGQTVGFRIASDGGYWSDWRDAHPFNDDGDVLFERRDVAREREDEEELEPFLKNSVLLVFLLVFTAASPDLMIRLLMLALSAPLAFALAFKASKVARVARRLLSATDAGRIHLESGRGIQIGTNNQQYNTYSPLNPGDPQG